MDGNITIGLWIVHGRCKFDPCLMNTKWVVPRSNLYANTIESVAWKRDVAWRCDVFGAAHMHMLFLCDLLWFMKQRLSGRRPECSNINDILVWVSWSWSFVYSSLVWLHSSQQKGVLWSHWFCCPWSCCWNVSLWFRWMILSNKGFVACGPQ